MLSLVYFFAVLSALVLAHEFGHFITAKRLGVRVEIFSLGFGPKLWSVIKGDTEYRISAIPLGGYVKMSGDDPSDHLEGKPYEFFSRSVADRFKIIFAGPLLNYILAFLIFSVIFMFGSPTLTTEVGGLLKDYPAEKAGIVIGDKILSVDGKPVKFWEEMTAIVHDHKESGIKISIERGGAVIEKEIVPIIRKTKDIFGKNAEVALIGVSPSQKIEKIKYGFVRSFGMGANKLLTLTGLTYKALWSIVTGSLSVKESMTGPIGIFVVTGQAAKLGLIYIFHLMGVLSASLAIFNLLPFPILDGGHILFLFIERLRGKPMSIKTQDMIANIGVALLILFTVFVFYSDIVKFGVVDKIVKLLTGK